MENNEKKFQSDDIGLIALALSKAQGQMGFALKDAENPFYKSSYADLASVWDAIRKPLSENKLAVIQNLTSAGGDVCVVTILAHESGQWFKSELTLPAVKKDPQGQGSAITYARRYALAAICGVAQADDDANSASNKQIVGVQLINDEQQAVILDLIDLTKTDKSKFCAAYKIASIDKLPANQFASAKKLLEKKVSSENS